jgi:hypothetical protein
MIPLGRRALILVSAALIVSLTSCKADPNRPHPVSGKVLFQEQPATGALVTFVPTSNTDPKAPRPTATVDKNGNFKLTTRLSYDGAPAGQYAVTIIYLSPEKMVDDQNAGPDLLEGRYANPATTPLRATIKAGKNELEPFNLQ